MCDDKTGTVALMLHCQCSLQLFELCFLAFFVRHLVPGWYTPTCQIASTNVKEELAYALQLCQLQLECESVHGRLPPIAHSIHPAPILLVAPSVHPAQRGVSGRRLSKIFTPPTSSISMLPYTGFEIASATSFASSLCSLTEDIVASTLSIVLRRMIMR